MAPNTSAAPNKMSDSKDGRGPRVGIRSPTSNWLVEPIELVIEKVSPGMRRGRDVFPLFAWMPLTPAFGKFHVDGPAAGVKLLVVVLGAMSAEAPATIKGRSFIGVHPLLNFWAKSLAFRHPSPIMCCMISIEVR